VNQPPLILCNGAKAPDKRPLLPGHGVSTHRPPLYIRNEVKIGPLNSIHSITQISNDFTNRLPDRFRDLLEIATYVNIAESETEEYDRRNFHFIFDVRDLDFWERQNVYDSLKKVLNFLSHDTFEFTFRQLLPQPCSVAIFETGSKNLHQFRGIDRVTLFSSEIDSLAGAVAATASGKPLVLFSQRHTAHKNNRIGNLYSNIKNKFAYPSMVHIPVLFNKQLKNGESNLCTNSFLLSAYGAAVAYALEAEGLQYYSNGVNSLDLIHDNHFSESPVSRATNPETLNLLQAFYRLVMKNDGFVVDNPFAELTQTEVLEGIAENIAESLIQYTCSCENTTDRQDNKWHCGLCEKCIDRRMAILATGLEDYDSIDNYLNDVFIGSRYGDHNAAIHYTRFASKWNRMIERDFFSTYILTLALSKITTESTNTVFDMHKRHATTIRDILCKQIASRPEVYVDAGVDKTSLLKLIGCGEHLKEDINTMPQTEYILKHEGEGEGKKRKWSVSFKGESNQVDNSLGLAYIHYLLDNDEAVPVRALQALVYFSRREAEKVIHSDLGVEKINDARTDEDISSTEAKEEHDYYLYYKNEKRELEKELRDTRISPNVKADLQQQLVTLNAAISMYYGLDGKSRPKSDPNYKASKNVYKALDRAYADIAEKLPLLRDHLYSSINRDNYTVKYTPKSPIVWDL